MTDSMPLRPSSAKPGSAGVVASDRDAARLAALAFDCAHLDPGPLCVVCGLPYRPWRGVPACECVQ